MTPVVYAILAAFGTFFFLAIAAAVVYFAIRMMGTIRSAIKAIEAIGPLLAGDQLTRLTNAFILMGKQGAEMIKHMEALDKTISLFYKFAIAQRELDASARIVSEPVETGASGGSRFVGYSEEKAASREAAAAQEQG